MRFEKGHKKIGGRRKGTPNKLRFIPESRAWWQQYLESEHFRQKMVKLIERGDANPLLVWMFNRLYGEPLSVIGQLRKVADTTAAGLTLQQQRELVQALPPGEFARFAQSLGLKVPERIAGEAGVVEGPAELAPSA